MTARGFRQDAIAHLLEMSEPALRKRFAPEIAAGAAIFYARADSPLAEAPAKKGPTEAAPPKKRIEGRVANDAERPPVCAKTPNGRDRAKFNAYQRSYMAKRRAAAKEAA
jgi:hypothetical protein